MELLKSTNLALDI